MPNWFQVTTTIVLVAFTIAQSVAAVMAVRQDARANKQERDERKAQAARDEKEKALGEAARKERELLDGLEKALAIHRESTELTVLHEQWKSDRSDAEEEHLSNTYKRLHLAKQLLEDQRVLNVDEPVTAKTIADLVDQALEGLAKALNDEADATTKPTKRSISQYAATTLDPFDAAKVWALIVGGKLTRDAKDATGRPIRFSSHIEAAALFGKRRRAHTSARLDLSEGYSLLFTIIDPCISRAVAQDTKDWEKLGLIQDAGYGEDEKADNAAEDEAERLQKNMLAFEELNELQVTEAAEEIPDRQEQRDIQWDAEDDEQERLRQASIEAERPNWGRAKRQRIIAFGQIAEESSIVYRYLGVFKRRIYDLEDWWRSGQSEFRHSYVRVADKIFFDGQGLLGVDEEGYRTEFEREDGLRKDADRKSATDAAERMRAQATGALHPR